MRIQTVCEKTGLTRKAIAYYIEQGLLSPAVLENGYRDFSAAQVARLQRVALLRAAGLSVEEARAVLADGTGDTLRRLAMEKELAMQREQARRAALETLASGGGDAQAWEMLRAYEEGLSLAARLMDAFPGYFGRFLCLHFAPYLTEPLASDEQRAAWREIVDFLDAMPASDFPPSLCEAMEQAARAITPGRMRDVQDAMRRTIESPEAFLEENKETLEQYAAVLRSEEYRASPAAQYKALLLSFQQTSGYREIFLPAMRRLSPAYDAYCRKLEAAEQRMRAHMPALCQTLDEAQQAFLNT